MKEIKKIRDFSLGKYEIQNLTRKIIKGYRITKPLSFGSPKRFVFKGQIYENNIILKDFSILANHFGDLIEEIKELYPNYKIK